MKNKENKKRKVEDEKEGNERKKKKQRYLKDQEKVSIFGTKALKMMI